MRENQEQEMKFEENRLKHTIALAEEQLLQAQAAVEGKQEELMEAKRDVRENAVHGGFANLYNSEDFEALAELSQCINPVTDMIADCEAEQRKIFALENIRKSPYFARIDFRFEEEEDAEKIYIGKASLTEKGSREIYVYDWRSPIASVFYRFMTGKAFYEAPYGRIEGEVKLKRQYEIKDGKLEYFFDTDRNISDEFLRRMLSKNTSPKMKAIVETIQKEQDIVIRDMDSDLLMVQGVAGSGKTSIALHRAAYLMYQGLQSKLSANSILIISPNTAFEQYISSVLPELGEENVNSAVFEDFIKSALKDRHMQTKQEFLELAMTSHSYKKIVKESMEFKTSGQFQKILDWFLSEIPTRWMDFENIDYKGTCIAKKEELRDWVLRRPETPLGVKLEQLEEYVLERIFGTVKKRADAEERNRIRQEMQRFTRLDLPALYGKLFFDKSCQTNAEALLKEREPLKEIWEYTRENLGSGYLYYEDAIAITYLYLKIYGNQEYRTIRQVVIDEAQDYYPLQFEIFRMLFPNAKFTVLGDVNQTLAKQEKLSFYDRIPKLLGKRNASLITLNKSFRCTNEILNFSLRFIESKPEIQSFNREGDCVQERNFGDYEAYLDGIAGEIGLCREKGYETICLLCKTKKNSMRLYEALKTKIKLRLITDENVESLRGTFLMPLYLSKGLEFDAVLVCDADEENYYDEDDKKLLYVACTRALHRLSMFKHTPGKE